MTVEKAIIQAFERENLNISSDESNKLKKQLQREYRFAELDHRTLVNAGELDMVVCLSGRAGFDEQNVEFREKKFRQHETIDTIDTITRFKTSLSLAQQAMSEYKSKKGNVKSVPVYFNGTAIQNEQLRDLLKQETHIFGFPSELVIVDDIPLPNTSGQVIGLTYFLYKFQDTQFKVSNLALVSSRYHLPRVMRAFGCDSPLLTWDYFKNNPSLFAQLPIKYQDAMREAKFFDSLRKVSLSVLGAGGPIFLNPNGKNDLIGDISATVNYSLTQSPPSIAREIPANVLTFKETVL